MISLPPLLRVIGTLVVVVGGLLLLGAFGIVGPRRLRRAVRERWSRRSDLLPSLVVLGAVVVTTGVLQRVGTGVSWLIGWEITAHIYALEGTTVATIQSIAWPPLTTYLAFVYLYGFSFLLVFPFVAYATLEDVRPFRETVAAFSVNYLVGLVAYTAFIAYGPRNFIPDQVTSLLYTHWPAAHLLTSAVSVNTDVFPSLHTSFAVTVALLAWRTRDTLPRWTAVAVPVAGSIVLATMYLGIHWMTDVVAGILLGAACTAVGVRDPLDGVDQRLRALGADALAGLRPGSERHVGYDEDDEP